MVILAITLAFVILIAVSAVLYLKYRLDNAPDNRDLEASLDSEVNKLTKHDPLRGFVIGIYKDGKSFTKGYGRLNREDTAAPDASTIFQIASVSKLFTAALLQILCDEGTLTMDAALGEIIGDSISLSPAAQRVTLKQLVTHTSGFQRIPKSLHDTFIKIAGKEGLLKDPYGHLGPEYIFDYLKKTEGKRESGKFKYSNFGMGLLGHVLEIVTKMDFESLVHAKLLGPLDMRNTTITLTPKMKAHLAQGYTATDKPCQLWTFRALAGAGGFNSNVEDMLKFLRANIDDSSILSPTLKKMHLPHMGGDASIGWMQPTLIDKFVGNKSLVWHNGMVGGYASYASIDTQAGIGVVILTNKATDVTMLGTMMARQTRAQSWSDHHTFSST